METTSHLPINFHTCTICPYRTRLSFTLNQHLKQHRSKLRTDLLICSSHTRETYKCEFCCFESELKVILTHHLETVHRENEVNFDPAAVKEYHCEQCDLKTFSQLILFSHYHSTDSNCNNSNLIINSPQSRQENVKQHIGEKDRKLEDIRWFHCEFCPHKAKTRSHLKIHVRWKHMEHDAIEWFSCKFCSYKTKLNGVLKRHIMSKHTKSEDISWFFCQHCSHKTKTRWHLKSHIVSKHTKDEEICWFFCQQCSHKSKTKRDLRQHVLVKHKIANCEDVRYFLCEHCSHKSKTRSHLKKHVIGKHTNHGDIHWFYCGFCDYKAKWNGDLKRHVTLKHNNAQLST